jgi:hypothetical protein
MVEREWPEVAKEGDAFLKKFQEAQALGSADRTALDPLIDEANLHYQAATERWAEVNNWLADREGELDEKTVAAAYKFLDPYESKVKEWTKKNKILKEFSRVK